MYMLPRYVLPCGWLHVMKSWQKLVDPCRNLKSYSVAFIVRYLGSYCIHCTLGLYCFHCRSCYRHCPLLGIVLLYVIWIILPSLHVIWDRIAFIVCYLGYNYCLHCTCFGIVLSSLHVIQNRIVFIVRCL